MWQSDTSLCARRTRLIISFWSASSQLHSSHLLLVVAKFQPIYNQIYDTKKESILNTETLLDSVTINNNMPKPKFVHGSNVRTSLVCLYQTSRDTQVKDDYIQVWQSPAFIWYWRYFGTEHCVFFGSEVAVSLKFTPLSTQTWTCWVLATCVCVFSRPRSPLMTDLSVRYLLKNYILLECAWTWLQGVKTAKLGKTSLSKLTFVSPK